MKRNDRFFDASSMLIKCGVCAAACAAVLLIKWAEIPAAESALSTLKTSLNEDESIDEMLGRLKFVELPGLIQVFSGSGKFDPPIVSTKTEVFDGGRLLAITAETETPAKACLTGTVKETGIDATLGNYVRIRGDNDTEIYLYGLSNVSVETGQPLNADDDVGKVSAQTPVYVAITVRGRPEEPEKYFALPSKPL